MAAQVGPDAGDSGAGIQFPPSLSGFQKWLDWVSGNPDPGTVPGPEDTGAANATGDYPNPYPPANPPAPSSPCAIPLIGGLVCGAQQQGNKDLLILGGVLIVAVVIFK